MEVIVTLQGSCDRSYRYPLRIVGSRVMQANADSSYRRYGAVSRSGAIRVIVVRSGQWADDRGRLTLARRDEIAIAYLTLDLEAQLFNEPFDRQ